MQDDEKTVKEEGKEQLISTILQDEAIRSSDILPRLLLYLFEHQDRFVSSDEIVTHVFELRTDTIGVDARVRERTTALRKELRVFASKSNLPLVCILPDAVRGRGYKIEFESRSANAATLSFWKPHISDREVYIVYVEQLIYQNWPKRFSLRDPDLNAENEIEALDKFKSKYSADYETKAFGVEEITVAYSYVAYGEVLARDRLAQWFDEVAFIKVETAVTRRMDEAKVWDSSAILLGDPRSHKTMLKVLKIHAPLDIKLEVEGDKRGYVGRAYIRNPNKQELMRTVGMNRIASPDGYSISYEPNAGTVLNLVTRVLNAGKTVTIFCSEVARTTEHLARKFTDDVWLHRCLNQTGWDAGWPVEFQILFLFRFGSLSDSHLQHDPEIVAWRSYLA